jgi:drug/metabolite transporter (DMT)-like permease
MAAMNISSPRLRYWLPSVLLFVLSVTWGYAWILAKQALSYSPPFAFAAERSVGGAIALFLMLKSMKRPVRLIAPALTLAIGLTQVTAFVALQTWALVEGGPGKTAVLIFTMPIWTLLMAWLILGERVRGGQWIAVLSTLTGLLFIIEPWDMHSSMFSKFLCVMAALSWATGTVLIKHLRSSRTVDLLSLTAWQMLLGAVPLVLLATLVPERQTDWSAHYVGILMFMSIVSTALCWWLWVYLLDRVPAWEASLSLLGTPVVAIMSSRLVLDEEFTRWEIAGIVLIGSGLLLMSLLGWMAARRSAASNRPY